MATGGFKSNATTDFLEEWKAKREKMRAKMLGDIAAATGAPLGATNTNSSSSRHAAPPGTEFTNNGNQERAAPAGNCHPSSYAVARSSSGSALKRPEEETHHPATPVATPGGNLKKAPPQTEKAQSPDSSPMACNDSDKESPSPGKGKEKKSSGPSARKGKGQIEKRKLREKRRSTGVVSIPSNESLDELDDDDTGEKDRREEEELVQANTFQNEAMTADPATGSLLETPRSGSGRHKSSAGQGSEEEVGGNRQRHNRHGRDGGAAAAGSLEKRMEELEKELARERQENARLLKAHQDKDDLIGKLKEEIDLLNRDLDDIEDENEQLKQENKTLLKVVGQLTR
ncbi:PRKC apoptosis WT1 regulator protein [Acanthochromis polyacanthus]|uniref:PRKC, apoptosis, WT1, regulator n=1 Tax=Acanthochromis polyacanthus TaxID=80966 RepID=A0A3Q1EKH6_9TELE|nr:PRKC apoptosis WT1 regulator protein [Acanthochromis polyacanthus]XP_022057446.1 PRKC apoptosis WT1 regulator protein [Acanthochromis polyacanthus]